MAVPGIFASDQGIVGNRVGDFAAALLQINPTGSAPLLALTSGMRRADAHDSMITWFEESKITGRTAVVSGGTTTTVVVADGSSYIPGTILEVEASSEMVIVTAVSGNTLTVVRGISGTSIVSVSSSDFVNRIGTALEEGSGMPVAVVNQGSPRTNYTQIFRNAWSITGTAKAIKWHTGSQIQKNKIDAAFFHAEDIERSILWAKKHVGILNTKPFRIQDGLIQQIETNGGVTDVQGNETSLGEIRDFLRRIFANNIKGKPNERLAFVGDLALQTLNEAVRLDGQHEFVTENTAFGLKFTTFVSPFGSIKLLTHPLMNENPTRQKDMYVIHPGGIRTRWLRRTNTEGYDKDGLRIAGKDADEGVITSEMCIECMAASVMGTFRGIDTAVVTGSET